MYLSIYLFIYLSVCLPVCLSACLSVCPTVSLKAQQFCETSSIFELGNIQNEAILRDFLNFWTSPHQKRSNSARLPQFLNLTTSKTKQFCETSTIFEPDNIKNEAILRDFLNLEVDNIKNETILRDFLQKWKVECRAKALVPMRFTFFPLHLSKVLRLRWKKWCQVRRSAVPVTQKSSSQNWRSDVPKCNPSQEISAARS